VYVASIIIITHGHPA